MHSILSLILLKAKINSCSNSERCLYKISCNELIKEIGKNGNTIRKLNELKIRRKRCNKNYTFYFDSSNSIKVKLSDGSHLKSEEFSEFMLKEASRFKNIFSVNMK